MNPKPFSAARTPSSAAARSLALPQRLSALYGLAERSEHVFGSPLGPFLDDAREYYVPRFVYFGPHTSHESVQLAVLAGFGRHDRVAVNALLTLIDSLARTSEIGQSLNISFFPVVNVAGLIGGAEDRDLTEEPWDRSHFPEIALLKQEILRSRYQAFIRVTTTADDRPSAWVRSAQSTTAQMTDAQVYSSADFQPWPAGFEIVPPEANHRGLLSLANELPFAPFEVELALPADWPQRTADRELAAKLKGLIVHYRAFLAYGQHL